MTKNIYHDIHMKICDNDITDDIIDAIQNTTPQLHNFTSAQNPPIYLFSLKQAVFMCIKAI